MKVLYGVLCFFLSITLPPFAIDLETVRQKYPLAATDKSVCLQMIDLLEHHSGKNSTHLAYLGAFQAIWAEHTWNPSQKLRTFNKGKGNIEKAVKADPDNVEIRFVRYTIQSKSPKFLGYNSDIETDKAFVNVHKGKVSSALLKEMIRKTLD